MKKRYKNRYEYATLNIGKGDVILDYGSYDGSFLKGLANDIEYGVGVDVNKEVVNKFKEDTPANIVLKHIKNGTKLPFESNTFDKITMLDVLEHIEREKQVAILKEFHRILKNNSVLIITVPQSHFFSFLDTGNWKFAFPNLHKYYYILIKGRASYLKRYVECENGLIGDISAKKRWHEHFTRRSLQNLLYEANFKVDSFDGAGFFCRIISIIRFVLKPFIIFNPPLQILENIDRKYFKSTHLFSKSIKIST